MKKRPTTSKPRYCDKCGLGLAQAQTTETCPRCHPGRPAGSYHDQDYYDAHHAGRDFDNNTGRGERRV